MLADKRHLPVKLRRKINEHLHPVHARGERRDDELALGAGEELLECVDDFDFGPGEPAAIDVRAVGKEHEHTLRAKLREPVEVEMLTIDRRLVDLEVAGVKHDAHRRRDGERHAVGHAVRDAEKLDGEGPDRDALPGLDRFQPLLRFDAVLFELRLDERERHRGAVDGAVKLRQHVGNCANVILVAVRQHERLHFVASRLDVGEVRNDQIDPELIGLRKHHAGIDEDGGVLP